MHGNAFACNGSFQRMCRIMTPHPFCVFGAGCSDLSFRQKREKAVVMWNRAGQV